MRSSTGTASLADTQWMLPLTFTLSAPGVPERVSGRYSQRTCRISPLASRSTPVQRTTKPWRRRTIWPGVIRKKPLGGFSAKSSRSIHSSRLSSKRRMPRSG